MIEQTTESSVRIAKLKQELDDDMEVSKTSAIGFVIPNEEEEEYYEDDE